MIFNSIDFLLFFPIVVLVYYGIPNSMKRIWLLAASYFFYMCWNVKYALLLLASTVISFGCGLAVEKCQKQSLKKSIVIIGVLCNLSILFIFKYFGFFSHILEEILEKCHIQMTIPAVSLLLPVGISFYTFQALGYVIDVYRGEVPAERNIVKYALFVSFFPQLVAGPIERSKNMLPQLDTPTRFEFEKAKSGFLLMLWGFFLKIVIADRIALFVDEVYGNYGVYQGVFLIAATVLFAVQIYCDFYGYSIIALGAARILGIELMDNFNAPYFSVSISQFWKNWHISLTSWFRDYVYIPLGGNRKGTARKYCNILVVFLISGLWHGAALSFVIWGGLNGLYQVLGALTKKMREECCNLIGIHRDKLGYQLLRGAITFALVDFAWIFFRANGTREAAAIIKSMLSVHNTWILFDGSLYQCGLDEKNFGLLWVCLLILAAAEIAKKLHFSIHAFILRQDKWFQWIFISLAIMLLLTFGKYGPMYDAKNFIYFQF